MRRAETIYRALLRCYPAPFRHEYGDQMFFVFNDQLDEARRTGGTLQPARLWIAAVADALIVGPREHAHLILQDLRYALRLMSARLSFTCVAVLSLALGIGANTAIFSLWNGVLHASLPMVDRPGKLVILTNPNDSGMWTGHSDGIRSWLTYAEFEQLRDNRAIFSGLMASQSSLPTWQVRVDGGEWEDARGRLVSGAFFQVLGVRPAIGRGFTAADDRAETHSAVISYNYWQRRFAGRPDVLGKPITLRKTVLTIVGVGPRGFIGETVGQNPDLWVPLRMQPSVLPGRDLLHDSPPDKAMWLHVFARLAPGVTRAQAEDRVNASFMAGLRSFYGEAADRRRDLLDQRLHVQSAARGASAKRPELSESLTALLAAVGVLLLITCANLANLLLARGAARRPEIALRLSLGASRERIVRQLVTESLTLAAMGGVAALAVAYVIHGGLVSMLTESDRRFHVDFTLNLVVLGFVVATTIAAALIFGLLPAWQVTRTDGGIRLKGSRNAVGALGQLRSGRYLVSLQLALSFPLLVGAGLLARTVYNLQHADLGFTSRQLVLAGVDLREAGYQVAHRNGVLNELVDQIQRIPGVRTVSFSQLGVFSGGESLGGVSVEGYTPAGEEDRGSAVDVIGPGYFSALGIPIRLGREILESDVGDAARVCVINEAFAKRFFEGRNPIGLQVTALGFDNQREEGYRVVGVAGNAHTQSLRGDVVPRYFVAARQSLEALKSPTLLIRTAIDGAQPLAAVRKTIERVDDTLPIDFVRSMEQQLAPQTAQDRTTAQLALVFGCVALTLAAIGLYGVLSYGVARRTAEIAIRIALGAQTRRVISMVLRETSGLVVAGLVVGAGLAYAGTKVIDSQLYGVAPQDRPTLAAAAGLLLLVALSAAYFPARRASRVDPIVALRQQGI
jgi:predicted permease